MKKYKIISAQFLTIEFKRAVVVLLIGFNICTLPICGWNINLVQKNDKIAVKTNNEGW